MATLTEQLAALNARLTSEEQRNAYLVEFVARYGLEDPEALHHARRLAEACSPGIVDAVRESLPN